MSGYLGLEGKRALVTGGTKGVGQAVVAALREAGATALTTARSRPESLSNAEHFVVADVSTVEGCAAVADAVRDRLGGIRERPTGRRHTSDVPMACAILDMSASLISNRPKRS
jgi:NAD(P)-dependent dehydrogenase (short-subunit alcohol dehydrogenase family)